MNTTENLITEDALFIEKGLSDKGLSDKDIKERITKGLVNGEQNIKTKSVGQILRTNIFTFFNFLFIVLAIILIFFIPQTITGYMQFGFVNIVILNSLIGIIQEIRAKKTIEKLSLLSAPKVIAMRNSKKTEIALKDIVLDEIILLETNNQICADAKIIDGSIEVNESLLTGEPDAIIKSPGDEVLSGSFVISGKATSKVIRIGKDNYATKITKGAKYLKRPSSEILRTLGKIIKFMAFVIVPLGILLFCMKYFAHTSVDYGKLSNPNLLVLLGLGQNDRLSIIIINTVGSLIGMIPSGLVGLSSAVFCISVIRLAKHKTLAQDLYCVETLARVDMLCLDKTGTITSGKMEVNKVVPKSIDEKSFNQKLKDIMVAIDDNNSTAEAIKDYTNDFVCIEQAKSFVPFSSIRKWSSATFSDGTYILGAPEFIFKNLTQEHKNKITEFAKDGNRVLILTKSQNEIVNSKLPNDMQFLGYILITDQIRPEAPETLKYFREQGVTTKIISGDNPITVSAVAKRAGLIGAEKFIDLSNLSDKEVVDAAEKFTVFGRVTPDQKLLLIKTLKKNKHTVGMTGDGVNDVLALKEADCSIAMASGSDAAKNVSSIVLLDSNFASMPKVVAEGRRSINNLERSAGLYLMKTMYSLILTMIFTLIPEQLPYIPSDLTIIGAFTIGFPSFFLALEPNKERIKGRFLTKVLSNALPGSLTVVFCMICVIIMSKIYPSMNMEETKAMFFMMTAIPSFYYLAKVCWKFNIRRTAMYMSLVAVFTSLFFLKFPNANITKYIVMPHYFTPLMSKGIALITFASFAFFIVMVVFIEYLNKLNKNPIDKFYNAYARQIVKKRNKI